MTLVRSLNDPRRSRLWLLVLGVALVLVCVPRFNQRDMFGLASLTGPLSDQLQYMAMVEHYRGQPRGPDRPLAPFTYRPLVPLLAAPLPFDAMTAINVIDVASLLLALPLLYGFLGTLRLDPRLRLLGVALFVFSFPVFYYGSIGRIDPPSITAIIAGAYGISSRRMWFAATAFVLGMLVRETTVILIPVVAAHLWFERGSMGRRALVLAGFIGMFVAIWLLTRATSIDPTPYVWRPTLRSVGLNGARLRAWLTLPLGLGIPGIVALLVLVRAVRIDATGRHREVALCVVGLLAAGGLYLFAWVAAYVDARFLWPSYPFTIALTLLAVERWAERRRNRVQVFRAESGRGGGERHPRQAR